MCALAPPQAIKDRARRGHNMGKWKVDPRAYWATYWLHNEIRTMVVPLEDWGAFLVHHQGDRYVQVPPPRPLCTRSRLPPSPLPSPSPVRTTSDGAALESAWVWHMAHRGRPWAACTPTDNGRDSPAPKIMVRDAPRPGRVHHPACNAQRC